MSEPKSGTGDNQESSQQIKKPGVLNQLVPYIITAGIFVYLFYAIDFRKMFQILLTADLALFIPTILAFSLIFGLVDSFTFGQAYSWFNAPLTNFEKIECRTAPYVVQVIFSPIAEVLFVLYMWRKKVSPAHAISSTIWTVTNDIASISTALTIAIIYNLKTGLVPAIGFPWLVVMLIWWTLYFGNLLFWHSPLNPKMSAWIERSHQAGRDQQGWRKIVLRTAGELIQLLRTFSLAKWYHYLWVYGIRIILLFAGLASNFATLKALGLKVPIPLAVIAIPLIFYAHFLPINVAGYGGPQALAFFFFSVVGHCGSKEEFAAYSFLWSTGFLVGRSLFSAVLLRGFIKRVFPAGFRNWRKGA